MKRAMIANTVRNFHVPLPENVYDALGEEAAALGRPATVIAREAIEAWLRERRRASVHEAIAAYAAKHAGTTADLAPRSGSEQTGRRPVVVSHNGFNAMPAWRSASVVPFSISAAQARRGPTAMPLAERAGGLRKAGVALCHQVTTLDRDKLIQRIGALPWNALARIEEGLKAALDLE